MTPFGAVFIVVIVIVLIFAFGHDRKKSSGVRREIDEKFEGRHTADFKLGYIADNILMIKSFPDGYISIDLTKASKVGAHRFNGMTLLNIYGEDGKLLPECKKLKTYYKKDVTEAMDAISENCNWITDAYQNSNSKRGYLPAFIVLFAIGLMIVAAYLFGNKAPDIDYNGVEIKIGTTKASAFIDAGYDLQFKNEEILSSYYAENISVTKNGKRYALITVYNKGLKTAPLKDCTIGKMYVTNDNGKADSFSVNGSKIFDMSEKDICDNLDYEERNGERLYSKKGGYTSYIDFEDSKPYSYEISLDFGKKYKSN